MFLKFIGKLTEANEELLEVDSLLGQPSDDPFIMFHSINCRDGLAEILADQGEYDEAHALFSQALEIATALASNDADNIDDALLLSTIESHFAQLLAKMEQMTEATERFDSSVARLENLVQRTPDRCDIQSRLAFVLQYYGRMEFAAGNAEKAAQLFGRAKTQWEALLAPSTATDANSALDLNYLAWFLVICPDATLRDPTRAESLARRALEVSPHNPDFSATLGAALYRQDKFTDAKPAFAAAEKNRGEPSARDLFFLSMIHVREGDQLAAETLFQQAESLMAEQQPENAELKQLRDEAQSLRTPR
jgi:tetratricopeptide (TPR) repeat protein